MTLADVQAWLDAGMTAYADGGDAWLLTSGVQVASTYEQMDSTKTACRLVYAWLETLRPEGQNHSRTGYERVVVLFARGRIVATSPDTLMADICSMTDDLERALVTGSGVSSDAAHGRVQISAGSPIKVTDTLAETLVAATVTYYKSF